MLYCIVSIPWSLHSSVGRPVLRYKDVCKRDLKAGNINLTGSAESVAADRNSWRALLSKQAPRWERGEKTSGKRGVNVDGRGQLQFPQCQARTTSASTATEPAVPKFDSTATTGAAT